MEFSFAETVPKYACNLETAGIGSLTRIILLRLESIRVPVSSNEVKFSARIEVFLVVGDD